MARPHSTPGPIMRDFESYYAAGAAWKAHEDPYSAAIWKFERAVPGVRESPTEILPFVGPPWTLPVWSIFGALPFASAAAIWAAALAIALLWFAIRMADVCGRRSPLIFLGLVCILCGFGPLTSDLALGQAAFLSFAGCVLAGSTAAVARPAFWGAVIASIQPNVGIAVLCLVRRRPALLALAAACIALAVLMFAEHLPSLKYYGQVLRAHGAAEHFALIQVTPSAVLYGFGIPSGVADATGTVCAIGALALLVWAVRRNSREPLWPLAATFSLLPFAVPFFHEHDFVILLVPVLLYVRFTRKSAQTAAAIGAILVSVDWLGLAQRPDGVLQATLLAGAVACGVIVLGRLPPAAAITTAATLFLVPVAGAASALHPAPVWPDAMRGALSLKSDIAAAWHDELSRTGLFAVQPLWAALRSLTLAGAALLAWSGFLAE